MFPPKSPMLPPNFTPSALPQTLICPPEWTARQTPAHWLAPDELQRLARFPSPQRRQNWLAGRLALKRLLQATFQLPPTMHLLAPHTLAPSLSPDPLPHINWSLSHSHGCGAATYARTPAEGTVGIDIQLIRPTRPHLARRILSPFEHAQLALLLARMTSVEAILLLWTLKEAAIKARRLPWQQPLSALQVHILGPQTAQITVPNEPRSFPATYTRMGNFWLARALRPPASSA